MAKQNRVFDSWAFIAFFEDEPAAEEVESLISQAHESDIELWATNINLGEVWYNVARSRSEGEADHAIAEILRLGFKAADIDWELTRKATKFKAKAKLAYADCFAAALAEKLGAELVTGDPEFKQLSTQIKIHWLPRR
jgi:predicted nucleic acid-binding protein